MRKTRGTTAFYLETLLLILFLLASLTVLVKVMGTAKQMSRAARELSASAGIAQSAAEQFAASTGDGQLAEMLGAQQAEDGALTAWYDAAGLPLAPAQGAGAAAYQLELFLERTPQGTGTMRSVRLVVLRAADGTQLYELYTQKYQPGGSP